MKIKSLFLIISIAFVFSVKAASFGGLENRGITFSGVNSEHGQYIGEMELRTNNDTLSVTRIITYESFKFENLAVQEVWTGVAVFDPESRSYIIEYDLRQADFLNMAEGFSRSAEDYIDKTRILQKISIKNNSVQSESFARNNEIFEDHNLKVKRLSSKPLWENKRYKVESIDHESSTLIKIGMDLMNMRLLRWFHNQDFAQKYADRKEFKSKKQYFVYDPTDYDFYQKNPDILRVVNKIPDTISLIEDVQRRNAYAPTLSMKMNHFEEAMKNFHINEFGLFSSAQLDSDGNFEKYTLDGDSALWTGMYLASQAMRYKITKEEVALNNLKKSLNGLMLLMDITESSTEFARGVIKYDENIKLSDKLHRGRNQHSDKIWLSTGNNDMYKGLIHGFIWAYLTLPESEKSTRQNLLEHMARLPYLTVAEKIQNKAPAYGLRALALNSNEDREKFVKNFKKVDFFETLLNIEGDLHVGGVVDWSGINLGMVSTLTDLLIAKALGEKAIVEKAKKGLVLQWKDLALTKRDFLTIATYAFAIKDGFDWSNANEFRDGYSTKKLKETWERDLFGALWSLREIPINRSKYDTSYDFSLRPDWCLSWWPRLPWKSITKKNPATSHFQGVDSYPLFESRGIGSTFIWKDHAFGYTSGSRKSMKAPGTDFLYSYWMAKLSGLIQ